MLAAVADGGVADGDSDDVVDVTPAWLPEGAGGTGMPTSPFDDEDDEKSHQKKNSTKSSMLAIPAGRPCFDITFRAPAEKESPNWQGSETIPLRAGCCFRAAN